MVAQSQSHKHLRAALRHGVVTLFFLVSSFVGLTMFSGLTNGAMAATCPPDLKLSPSGSGTCIGARGASSLITEYIEFIVDTSASGGGKVPAATVTMSNPSSAFTLNPKKANEYISNGVPNGGFKFGVKVVVNIPCVTNKNLITITAKPSDGSPDQTKQIDVCLVDSSVGKNGNQSYVYVLDATAFPPFQAPGSTTSSGGNDNCQAGSFSFLICPLTDVIVGTMKWLQDNIIIPFLTVTPLSIDPKDTVFQLWDAMRNFANITLVILFFVVIFSQATSFGLSKYGIKRMLPRLLLAAVLANLSYYLLAFIVDMFNLFGAGVAQLATTIVQQGGGGGQGGTSATDWFVFVGGGLVVLFLAAGQVLPFLFSLILGAFFILLVAVAVLVLRQMIIIILVVVSPILFVLRAYDGTESLFDKSEKLFMQLMFMYPMIILLFSAGKLVGLLFASGSFKLADGTTATGGVADAIKGGIQLFAAILPMIGMPWIFGQAGKFSGNLHTQVGKFLGQGTQGFRYGTAAALGNRLPNNGFGKVGRGVLGAVSGLSVAQMREAQKQNYEEGVKTFRTRLGAGGVGRYMYGKNDAALAQQINSERDIVKGSYDNAKTLMNADFKKMAIDPGAAVNDYKDWLNAKKPAGGGTTGGNGRLSFSGLNRRQQNGLVANATSGSGNLPAIDAMLTSGDSYLEGAVAQAAGFNSDGLKKVGGGYAYDSDFNDRGNAAKKAAALGAAGAKYETTLDYAKLFHAAKTTAGTFASSTPAARQIELTQLLRRAASPTTPEDVQLATMLRQGMGSGATSAANKILGSGFGKGLELARSGKGSESINAKATEDLAKAYTDFFK